MRSIHYLSKEKQIKKSIETLNIYAPLADRLGAYSIKTELENISFKILHKKIFLDIDSKLIKYKKRTLPYIKKLISNVEELLQKYKIKYTIQYRYKTPYSIYKTLQKKNIPLNTITINDITDIIGIRINIDGHTPTCYTVLGIIHNNYITVLDRFKDFIAVPKATSYQSLHTSIIYEQKYLIEFQIRTEQMHKNAEYGLAAHWRYKNKDSHYYSNIINELLELNLKSNKNTFLKNLQDYLKDNIIYVITPNGDIKTLPAGSTIIDYAYSIHTNIGNHCVSAKVNGNIKPIRSKLETGSIVEIITSSQGFPSIDWIKYTKTAKAKRAIRHFIDLSEKDNEVITGRKILINTLHEYYNLPDINSKNIDSFLKKHNISTNNLLTIYKSCNSKRYLTSLIDQLRLRREVEESNNKKDKKHPKKEEEKYILLINDKKGIDYNIAKCCNPTYMDYTVGYLSYRGIKIHKKDCKHVNDLKIYKMVDTRWIES